MSVKIIDTTLRDAQQSLLATRLKTCDMLPIARLLDEAGFYSLEVWGGATFDVALRYLREDPWERVKLLKEQIRKTKLQMLLRGQNLVGYRHYPDDVVKKFIEFAHKNGIDIFRVFDALNDIRNLEVSIKEAKRAGAIVQGAISYTISPVHTIEYYLNFAEELISLEADFITIKDMAGVLAPDSAYKLVTAIKEKLGVPVNVHTHSTSGMAVATYLKAIEAGAEYIDTSISPLAFGTAQPGIQTLYYTLPLSKRPSVNLKAISQISKYLYTIMEEKYNFLLDQRALTVDPDVLMHQIPGGMLSNLIAQLREQNALDKLDQVLAEVPKVREDLGWPPLVTPMSQIVGTQAVLNVVFGRYKTISREVVDYIKGLYGKPPAPIKEDLKKLALKDEKEVSARPAEFLEPRIEKCTKEVESRNYYTKDEDIITYCLFPEVAKEFFELRRKGQLQELRQSWPYEKVVTVLINGKQFKVGVEAIDLKAISMVMVPPTSAPLPQRVEYSKREEIRGEVLRAPIAGKVVRIYVEPGQKVNKGQKLLTLESMKMNIDIHAPKDAKITQMLVRTGDRVESEQPLAVID
ncbi:MAG: pyruvate/oxaloacetate carboxyltransferase [Desulfurococcaceae archaeon]